MPDRYQELLHQRRLIEEHLAWLNREIARQPVPSPPADVSKVPALATPLSTDDAPSTASRAAETRANLPSPIDPDAILAEYQLNPTTLQVDVKRGCLMYFAAALGILILGVLLLYLNHLRHPLSSPPRAIERP